MFAAIDAITVFELALAAIVKFAKVVVAALEKVNVFKDVLVKETLLYVLPIPLKLGLA